MTRKMNKGRFSVGEQDEIRVMRERGYTVKQIASKLNRDENSVDKWIEKHIGKTEEQKEEIELANELRNTPYYKELQRQFDNEDIEIFEMHWQKLWKQFKNDVFHTEEMQIMDLCKVEVLMNKLRRESKRDELRTSQIMEQLSDEQDRRVESGDDSAIRERREAITNLNRQLDSISAANSSREKEFKEYLKEKNNMLKTLKGTRDQRIKDIESNKDTWPGLLKRISSDPDFREEMGKQWEKVRLASEYKKQEMAEPIEYEDGKPDSPILRPEDFDNTRKEKETEYER